MLLSLLLSLLSLLLSLAMLLLLLLLLLQLLKPLLQAWYWDSKPALVRRLMRLVLDRGMLDSMHPCGEKYEEVRCIAMFMSNYVPLTRWSRSGVLGV
jgi:hypothetical protein